MGYYYLIESRYGRLSARRTELPKIFVWRVISAMSIQRCDLIAL